MPDDPGDPAPAAAAADAHAMRSGHFKYGPTIKLTDEAWEKSYRWITDTILNGEGRFTVDHPIYYPTPTGVRTATRRTVAGVAGRLSDVWYVIRHGLPDPDDA